MTGGELTPPHAEACAIVQQHTAVVSRCNVWRQVATAVACNAYLTGQQGSR
jgi:hypothetical protein